MTEVLILSDGRAGHLNQSIAFVKYLNCRYDIVNVSFKSKLHKSLSYLFDFFGLKIKSLFVIDVKKNYKILVSTGSTTYYATKVLAKQMSAKSIVMMLPKGYQLDFDTIFAQNHDHPPIQKNIIIIPANFSYIEPKHIYIPEKKSIGIIIGGDNKVSKISLSRLKIQLDFIKKFYKNYEIAITTSPRTSVQIESFIESYKFDYTVIYSNTPINPIPDFLEKCQVVFITEDSTSMISEAVSYGKASVIVLPSENGFGNKFKEFIAFLEEEEYLHVFDGTIKKKNRKISFSRYVPKVMG